MNATVAELMSAAFQLAAHRQGTLLHEWIRISHRIGSLLPSSLMAVSLQEIGRLDMVLRCMEDDFQPAAPEIHSGQNMFSALWVGSTYEIFRLLKERELGNRDGEFERLEYDLRLLRIPLEKYEIAKDTSLKASLHMSKGGNSEDIYIYSKSDPTRAHIMPMGMSHRGSIMWQVIDLQRPMEPRWLERRTLSERMIELWTDKITTG